jgi:hypothetical protein
VTAGQLKKFRLLFPDKPVMISCNKNFVLEIQTGKPPDEICNLCRIALSGDISAMNDYITLRNINRMVIAMSIGQSHNDHAANLFVCHEINPRKNKKYEQ